MSKEEFDPLARMASGPELQERLAAASAAPAEGREADERAAFEAWAKSHDYDLVRHRDETYATQDCHDAWEGWQARALLAKGE